MMIFYLNGSILRFNTLEKGDNWMPVKDKGEDGESWLIFNSLTSYSRRSMDNTFQG